MVHRRPLRALLTARTAWLALRAWAALRPTAFPYFARSILDVPRPLITRRRLLEILAPVHGERILEIGPGTGYYSTRVAARLKPGGTLDILDVGQHFLDHTTKRARAEGLANVIPTLGDGSSLPYPDGCFDAASFGYFARFSPHDLRHYS
jgi:ubiquinone/menaquinone biosynthesis C-methylase UbiE